MNGGKTMIQKTYSARIKRIRSMLNGLIAGQEQLQKYGATPDFLASLAMFKGNLSQIQQHRQDLKQHSIAATAAKNCSLKEAEHLCSQARKWVRRQFAPDVWGEFGFRKGEYGKTNRKVKIVKGKK
jgi:hypothetical protein